MTPKKTHLRRIMSPPKSQLLAKKRSGRPRVYCPDKIAEEMLEWVKDESSINIAQFCADRHYLPQLIWQLDKEFEDFNRAYILTRLKLAERRERMLNADILNYGAFQRYQRGYDPFLNREEDIQEDKEASRRKGIVEAQAMNLCTLAKMAADGKIAQKD